MIRSLEDIDREICARLIDIENRLDRLEAAWRSSTGLRPGRVERYAGDRKIHPGPTRPVWWPDYLGFHGSGGFLVYLGETGRWKIYSDPKPIPDRRHDWDFEHEDYDGPGDRRRGTAKSARAAIDRIREIEEDIAAEEG